MKKSISLFISLFSLTIALHSFGQSTEVTCNTISTLINGVYQSKNLRLQETSKNSIQSITINSKEYPFKPVDSVFEIDLSDLKVGQKYTVQITYCESKDAPYKILNPEALK